jgi:hypothetical protein
VVGTCIDLIARTETGGNIALPLIVVAPTDNGAIGSKRCGVRVTRRDLADRHQACRDIALAEEVRAPADDSSAHESSYTELGACSDFTDRTQVRWHIALAVRILPPHEDLALLPECDVVISTGINLNQRATRYADRRLNLRVG